jgi:hypothetical protein
MLGGNATMTNSPYSRCGAELVDMGYAAIPVMPGSKRPGSMSNGQWYGDMDWSRFCDRLPTEIETNIWSRWEDAGVCVAIDKALKVIDLDTDDAELRAAIEAVLPTTDTVKKRGNKGYSAFFRGSEAIVNRPFNLILPGGFESRVIDLLAHGRQTVLPPTLHPDTGKPYEWLTDDTLMDTPIDKLPELPDDIADRLADALRPFGTVQEHRQARRSGEEIFGDTIWREANSHALEHLDMWVPDLFGREAKRQRDGTYRARAFWRGVENFNVGIHPDGITDWGASRPYTPIDLVMAANCTSYHEVAYKWLIERTGFAPKEDKWTLGAMRSAAILSAKANAARADIAVVQPQQIVPAAPDDDVVEIAPVRAPRAKLDPFSPEVAGGLIELISQWIMDTGRRPVPEFAVMAAASFVGTMFGRQAIGPTGAGLNTYMVGIAGPGFGKEHPQKSLHTLAMDTRKQYLIGPGEVTSGSAIEKVCRSNPVFVMPWDEMGVVLQSVTGNGSSAWAKTIRKVLLEVFSKSNGVWSGKEHADPQRMSSTEPIHCPTVSLLGMSTPTTFYRGLTEETLSDGFIARLIVVEVKQRPERQDAPPQQITPPSLIDAISKAHEALPGGTVAKVNWRNAVMRPTLYTVPWASTEAERRWLSIEDWQISQIEDHGAHEGLMGRTAEHVIKLATIRALSRDPSKPSVDVDDVEWGYGIVQRSIDCIDAGIADYMAGSQFEELCKAIVANLRRAEDGTMRLSHLVRRKGISKADDRMVKSALERLTLAGDIHAPEASANGVRIRLKQAA